MAKVNPSVIDLLRGRVSFSTEPLWYRLLVLFIQLLYLLLLVTSLVYSSREVLRRQEKEKKVYRVLMDREFSRVVGFNFDRYFVQYCPKTFSRKLTSLASGLWALTFVTARFHLSMTPSFLLPFLHSFDESDPQVQQNIQS